MKRASLRLQSEAMALISKSSWFRGSERRAVPRSALQPVAHLVVAAAGGHQQQPQQPSGSASPASQHQQQRDAHLHRSSADMARWRVSKLLLKDYPEETQHHIRSSPRRGASAGAAAPTSPGRAQQARGRGGAAASVADSGVQAAQEADLEKLLGALRYEASGGYANVIGSVERVPVANWAARQLLNAAAAAEVEAAPEAAHACVAAAQRLRRYAAAEHAERPPIIADAQAAAQQALQAFRCSSMQAQHASAPQQQQQQQRQPPAQQQQQQQPPVQQPETAADMPAEVARVTSQQQQQQQQPEAASDRELDAAAEEAHAEESGEQPPTPAGEEYVVRGGRRIKASTAAFRDSFAETAAAAADAGAPHAVAAAAQGGEQRTAEWFRLRERRLTASAFSKALGLFQGDRQQLWAEKVGMVQPFAGNDATAWGNAAEPRALEAYQAVTGQRIANCMFQVRHDDPVHGWLGASPDGLIESLSLDPPLDEAAAAGSMAPPLSSGGLPPRAAAAVLRGSGPLAGDGRGILEIKCPYNKGQPDAAVPPQHATWYYMPQVQGLMYIFDCDWCNLYIWTPQRGSAVYHVRRDRQYWARLWEVLADFWWSHVVPARQEFQGGRWEEVEQYRPAPTVKATEELRQWSKRMAVAAPVTFFRPQAAPRP